MYTLFFTQLIQRDLDTWLYPKLDSPLHAYPSNTPNGVYIELSSNLVDIPGNVVPPVPVIPEDLDLMYIKSKGSNMHSGVDTLEVRTFLGDHIFPLDADINQPSITPIIPTTDNLVITVSNGLYVYDTSIEGTVDRNILTDAEEVEVLNFVLESKTPLAQGFLRRQFYFPWQSEPIEQTYYSSIYTSLPPSITATSEWQPIETTILPSTPTINNNQITPLTIYDTNLQDYELFFPQIPRGLLFATQYEGTEIISRSYLPLPNRGYLPCNQIDLTMTNTNLQLVAWGIFGLIAEKEDLLLQSVLKELVYIYEQAKRSNVYGLPSNLVRVPGNIPDCNFEAKRSVFDNAWLGLAIVRACHYLCNRKTPNSIKVSDGIRPLLISIANLISNATNTYTGIMLSAFYDNSIAVDRESITTTVIGNLFLNQFLTIIYDINAHYSAAKSEVALYTYPLENNYEEDPLLLYEHLLLWYDFKKLDTKEVQRLLQNSLKSILDDLPLALGHYLYKTIPNKISSYENQNWLVENRTTKFAEDIYGTGTPELIQTSAYLITKNKYRLLDEAFYLSSFEALAYKSFTIAEAIRMLPTIYNVEAGSNFIYICNAIGQYGFEWFIEYKMLRRSLNTETASGIYLDNWLKLYDIKRIGLQSDRFMREKLISKVKTFGGTNAEIQNYLDVVYDEFSYSSDFPYTSFYDKDGVEYTTDDVDVINTVARSHEPSGIFVGTNTSRVFIPIEEISGIIYLRSKGYIPELLRDVYNLKPAGITLNFTNYYSVDDDYRVLEVPVRF